MCGICGFYSKKRETLGNLIEMNNTLIHRGPNDHGEEIYAGRTSEYGIGLAQRRLSIIDLSVRGHQPMHSFDKRVSLVFNGEIYNFQELKEELGDYPFQSNCDTEVIIAAYLKWGIRCVDRFNGMFAIALYDREDEALRRELEKSQKEKSELLMIVDLERNDLNRVCRPGSVKVTELFSIEEYATVFHQVANVEGVLQDGEDVMSLLTAAFPGGSVTGAPKRRAMEITDELECGKRNIYTGSIGYITLDGKCDFNIVIRTVLYRNGRYYLGVGGGITADSDPGAEYEETRDKAKAILSALQ